MLYMWGEWCIFAGWDGEGGGEGWDNRVNCFGYDVDTWYNTRDNIGYVQSGKIFYIRFGSKSKITSSVLLREWMSENNLIYVFILNEPIETDLTSDQIAALNLSTYQGITNIGTDTMPQAGIDVEYIADTKTYIDNAIAEAIAVIPTE